MSDITLVTPIGPHWNLAWLQELAQSTLAATSRPVQWIIVTSGQPLREIHQIIRKTVKNSHITAEFVTTDNQQGPAAARNCALRHIAASWVLAVDHDDALLPGSLDRLLDAAQEHHTLWAAGPVIETDEFGNWLNPEVFNPFASRTLLSKNAYFLYRKNRGRYPFHTHGGALVARSYLHNHGWDTSMGGWGDHLTFFTRLSAQHEGAWIDHPVLLHRNHEHSLQAAHIDAVKEMAPIIYNRLEDLTK